MENKRYVRLRSDDKNRSIGPMGAEIPIIGSSLVPDVVGLIQNNSNGVELYEKALDQFKECGFNGFFVHVSYGSKDLEDLLKTILSKALERNIFVIFDSSAFSAPSKDTIDAWKKEMEGLKDADEKCDEYKKKYKDMVDDFLKVCSRFENFGGITLQDEPTYDKLSRVYVENKELSLDDFDNEEGAYYCLSNRYNVIRGLMPEDKVIMINLVGDQSSDQLQKHTYQSYLDLFSNICQTDNQYPYLWSYDLYPITEYNYLLYKNFYEAKGGIYNNGNKMDEPDLTQNGNLTVQYHDFYDDLILFNDMTNSQGSIYWTFIQGMEFMASKNYHPLAKERFLRFMIFSSLAMGCQGIMYWTYHQRNNQTTELYLSALIDRDDARTPAWYYAKKINDEIMEYNSVFRGAKLLEYGHVGSIYDGCPLLKDSIGALFKISAIGTGALVTRLTGGGYEYIVIVSHDIQYYQSITMYFNSSVSIEELTSQGDDDEDSEEPLKVKSSPITRLLAPGEYLIYRYKG